MFNKFMLVEKDKIVRKGKNVAEVVNNYFINITKTLNLKSSKNTDSYDIMELIFQFNYHVSIKEIKKNQPQIIPDALTLSPVTLGDVKKEIMNLGVVKNRPKVNQYQQQY